MRTIQILLLVCTMITSQAYAQIKVGTDGKAAVGKVHSLDNGRLKIGNDGVEQGLSFYDSSYGGTDFRIYRENNVAYFIRGNYHGNGLRINSSGHVAIGISNGYTNPASYFDGSFHVYNEDPISSIGARTVHSFDWGVAIKSYVYRPLTAAYVALCNGEVTFRVFGNGEVFSTGQYIQSDATTKKNIKNISNSLTKVLQLRGVSFDPVQTTEAISLDSQLSEQKESSVSDTQDALRPQISPQVLNQMNLERSRKRMGVIAQEVEAIVPEVVRTTPEGRKTVAYHELVGLLIEAIKEQQAQIEELKTSSSNNMLRSFSGEEEEGTIASSLADETITGLALYQNTPNPFNERTEIRYSLTGKESKALIYIFTMQGALIKKYVADHSGILIIEASELTPGMYIYTLVADGKEIGSKRMILTN